MVKEKAIKGGLTCLLALGMLAGISWAMGKKPAKSEGSAVMSEQKPEAEKMPEVAEATEVKGTQTVEVEGTSTTYAEEYVSKEIITANWGKELGKLGVYTSEKKVLGPTAMDVDREGNIYIFDHINWRVTIYDNKGSYTSAVNLEKDKTIEPYRGGISEIKVDSEGSMYITTGRLWPYFIRKYDNKGKLVKVYIEGYMKPCFSGDDEDYIAKFNAYFKNLDKRGILEIIKPQRIGYCSYFMCTLFPSEYLPISGYMDGALLGEISSDYRRKEKVIVYMAPGGIGWETYPGVPPALKERWKEFRASHPDHIKHNYIVIATEEGEVEKIIASDEKIGYFHPLKEDHKGNVYIYVSKYNKEKMREYWVYKYNYLGDLVAKIKGKPVYFWFYEWNIILPFISWNGEIYQIYWDADKLDEGFKVIKWERREK
jgi:hypothetical protein